jgi:hypothetical protein
MMEIQITGTREALKYFEEIVRRMLLLFPITRDEAVGRVNRFWAGQDFSRELKVNLLTHEDTIFWAKTIYYGPNAQWGKGEEGLKPLPYP